MRTRRLRAALAAMSVPLLISLAVDADAKVFDDLFIFGDSYSDTGSSFAGSNGTTAAAYMGALYGITMDTTHEAHPGRNGVNFAESGARVDVGPTPPATHPLSLTQQVAEFRTYLTSGNLTFDPSSTLFFLAGGLNDRDRVTNEQIGAATIAQVSALYALGGRYFEVALMPSLIPAFATAANFNPEFRLIVPELAAMFPDATIKLSDWGGYFDDVLRNAAAEGFTNATDPCSNFVTACADPDRHYYFYPGHPSDRAHRLAGAMLYAEALAIPEPMTVTLVAVGAAGLALMRRRRPVYGVGARLRASGTASQGGMAV